MDPVWSTCFYKLFTFCAVPTIGGIYDSAQKTAQQGGSDVLLVETRPVAYRTADAGFPARDAALSACAA
jgi:hypothetical protein